MENADAPIIESELLVAQSVRAISDAELEGLGDRVRTGSPFAPGTALPLDAIGLQLEFETGVWRETMLGGLLASWIMVGFGILSLVIFPLGAVIIGAGGCLLGAMALATRRPMLALTATLANLLVLGAGFILLIA